MSSSSAVSGGGPIIKGLYFMGSPPATAGNDVLRSDSEEKMKRIAPGAPHEESLYEDLHDPREASLYLNASIEGGDPDTILLALYDIAKANNLTQLAEKIRVNRVSLYKMLTKGGNPSFRNILKVLDATGIGICFVALCQSRKHTKHALAA